MLQTAALLLAESALNKLLMSDEVTIASLQKLSGYVFEFAITDLSIQLFIVPHNRGVQIQQNFAGAADTTFSGSLVSFQQLLESDNKSALLFGNGITISGNSQLATALQRIIANAEIDWQAMIANTTGDLVASQIATLFNATRDQVKLSRESVELNTVEYLQEELGTLVPVAEVDGFIEDINSLNQDCQRLAAKIAQLEARCQDQ